MADVLESQFSLLLQKIDLSNNFEELRLAHDVFINAVTAHTFINFILDAENGAQLSTWNAYASPNAAAEAFLDPEFLADEAVYPTDRSKLEFITNTGDFETNFSDAFSRAKG